MLIKYYNNPELLYSSKKRYRQITFQPFNEEEQKKVVLGDGAKTFIKTSSDNICTYVTIDNTRWFVIKYEYLNISQIVLYLQRDVIGEFGINNFFGKIERGYTDTILRNRKELGLNQILKKRDKLIPKNSTYGNFSVDNHNNELWGILYIKKPTEIDPSTGEVYPETVNINIPAFTPKILDYDFIENGSEFISRLGSSGSYIGVPVTFQHVGEDTNLIALKSYMITVEFVNYEGSWGVNYQIDFIGDGDNLSTAFYVEVHTPNIVNVDYDKFAELTAEFISDYILANEFTGITGYKLPEIPEINSPILDYNNAIIKVNNDFYKYNITSNRNESRGTVNNISNDIINALDSKSKDGIIISGAILKQGKENQIVYSSLYYYYIDTYNYTILPPEQTGTFTLDVSKDLVDEPYIILVCPLYDVKIIGDGKEYSIDKDIAFQTFNTIIQFLSGNNAYLVDAQVYPYCPVLTNVSTEVKNENIENFKKFPFFAIQGTSYDLQCEIQLLSSNNIKKEYIQREYSIVSPDQTGKYSFNFYDYTDKKEDINGYVVNNEDGINYKKLNITIKTALKPFSIISSAVIIPDFAEEKNILYRTYNSDLRGCQPSSSGFECSIATNAFEEYKRNNSNYQQIFNLQREELLKNNQTEKVNEQTSVVVNTTTASVMGLIGGAALGSSLGINPVSSLIGGIGGGIAGGLATGGIVNSAMNKQLEANENLRRFEEDLQLQRFNLEIGTIKNLPNQISRISSFNQIILRDFWYIVETYECTDYEKIIVDNFIKNYGYGIGVFDYFQNYKRNNWFLRGQLISSNLQINLHNIASNELKGGIYINETS